ncbi:MAG: AzlC family ABC transporter permease [Methylobacterium mesophilicum]|nr:AzlC family ABC transporter permease [Methylobacterium mesophilicum]
MSTEATVETAPSADGGWAAFWRGVIVSAPINLAVFPFGVLYGAVAVQNGLGIFDATLMSATIFGGASQLVGLQLFRQHVASWLVILSILAVNFRHVLYSAALGRLVRHWSGWEKAVGFFFLTDPQFAQAERERDARGRVGFFWYLGLGVAIWLPWVGESALGAWLGNMLPDAHTSGMDFLLPIYFLGILMDFRGRPLWLPVVAASAVASVVAFRFVGSPWHVSVGALAGILVAALWPAKPTVNP